ncbi:MAG: polyprenyl synthetase family protein, partial [Caldilineaceae bacterium]
MREDLQKFMEEWLPPLEAEMRAVLAGDEQATAAHYGMMQYHMGWVDASFAPSVLNAGKRLRPILCLLACTEVGGRTDAALPAAAAIEILHNFSLVHDDIEDGDEARRHRATVWKLWGVPLAINVGDGMFALAFAAMQRLSAHGVPPTAVLAALDVFTRTCIALTEGQYLDMSFEQRGDVSEDEYLRMIAGKTAALVGASVAIGAYIGGAGPEQAQCLQRFGQEIGLAFQIQDDVLGIWGDPAVTGKAAGNDVLRKKKSLPMLHALNHPAVGTEFGALLAGEVDAGSLPAALALLDAADARTFAVAAAEAHYAMGMVALEQALGAKTAA